MPFTPITRRSFLRTSTSFAAAALMSSSRLPGSTLRSQPFDSDPFSLGVASGDPLADRVILWTRLAPHPSLPGGGMPPEAVEVKWQVANDDGMKSIVQSGTAIANPEWNHSVHVDVTGLRANRWYWYQFKVGAHTSVVGRTHTMPEANQDADRLRFAFVSCQHYEQGFYTAYQHLAREDLDLIVHLGDYIYEYGGVAGRPRLHSDSKTNVSTLDAYRLRYSLYKTDPALQAAHAIAPWIATWDDHDVANDYAGVTPHVPEAHFLQRRAAAYQAYYENLPLRATPQLASPDLKIYRRLDYGRLASFHVLDTRQYRTVQPGTGRVPVTDKLLDPAATMLGAEQRRWLFDGLNRSVAEWNVLTQQIMFAHVDLAPGPDVAISGDMWPAYEWERRQVLNHLVEHQIKNPVVLAGDYHTNYANDLIIDYDRPNARKVGVEFVGTSISSGGDGMIDPPDKATVMAENPFVKFRNHERGYVSCDVTPNQWKAYYRTVPFVEKRGAPLNTRAAFVVERGQPTLQSA